MPQVAMHAAELVIGAAVKALAVEGVKGLVIQTALGIAFELGAKAQAPACMPPGSPPWEPAD